MRIGNNIEAVQKEHWFMASGVPCIITLTVPPSFAKSKTSEIFRFCHFGCLSGWGRWQ